MWGMRFRWFLSWSTSRLFRSSSGVAILSESYARHYNINVSISQYLVPNFFYYARRSQIVCYTIYQSFPGSVAWLLPPRDVFLKSLMSVRRPSTVIFFSLYDANTARPPNTLPPVKDKGFMDLFVVLEVTQTPRAHMLGSASKSKFNRAYPISKQILN